MQVWANETGGSAAMLRYHNVYGPGMPRDTPYAGVAAIFRSALERGDAPRVFEDGGQRRDFIHVDDIAAANLRSPRMDRGCRTRDRAALQRGLAERSRRSSRSARQLSQRPGGPEPVVTGRVPRRGRPSHHRVIRPRARRAGWAPTVRPRRRHARVRDGAASRLNSGERAPRGRGRALGRIRSKRHPPGTFCTVTSP